MKALFLLALFIFSINIFSQSLVEYYISPDGDDGNTGTTYQDPFATIDTALSKIPADTNQVYGVNIYVLPGEYTQHITVNKSGRFNYPIKIVAFSNQYKPIFYGNDITIFSGKDAVLKFDNARYNIIIEGLILRDVTANNNMRGIWMQGDLNILRHCEFYRVRRSAIVVQGSYNLIEHNIVNGIIGGSTTSFRGNCISVEGYYNVSTYRNAEYNLIQYNTLKNNLTHFAINIFPATNDTIEQPPMEGNKIYFNFVDSTGGGVYTRYQRNMEIIGNVFAHSIYDYDTWGSPGGGITFDRISWDTSTSAFNGGKIKIYNNTIALNDKYGLVNNNEDTLLVKNNIFVNNGQSTNGQGHILIGLDSALIEADIDYNCYYGTGYWRWGSENDTSFNDWQTTTGQDSHGMFENPLFVDTTNGNYSIQLHSPAKNAGTALAEVIEDLPGVKRPYWVDGVDIGAYELPEAQFRIGVTGLLNPRTITHNIEAVGTFWEKKDGLWDISSDPEIENSSYVTVGNTSTDKEEWDGFHFKWMKNSTSQASMGQAFYKVINDSGAYFYVDLRDAIVSYSPNIYIRYNADPQTRKYEYYNGSNFTIIENGNIIRIWQIKSGTPSTNNLESYWDNVLVMIPDGNHPRLVYGPNTDIGSINYLIYRKLGAGTYSYLTSTSNLNYTDPQYEFYYDDPPYYVYYKIKGENELYQTPYSNEVYNSFQKSRKIALGNTRHFEYALLQNYPNPFNPSTMISFSLKTSELVTLKVFDILGREVKTLVNERLDEGEHFVTFDASVLASGIYFYRITAGKFTAVKKLLLVR